VYKPRGLERCTHYDQNSSSVPKKYAWCSPLYDNFTGQRGSLTSSQVWAAANAKVRTLYEYRSHTNLRHHKRCPTKDRGASPSLQWSILKFYSELANIVPSLDVLVRIAFRSPNFRKMRPQKTVCSMLSLQFSLRPKQVRGLV